MNTSQDRWVWFLDDDVIHNLLSIESDNPELKKRATSHPAVVEAVRMHLAGNSPGAQQALKPALLVGNPDALLLSGQIAFEAGAMEEAASHYRRLAELKPDHPYASLNAGICLARQRRWRMAIEALQRAVVLEPDRAQSWFVLGVCLLNERRAAEARASFARSLRLREEYAPAWFGQAAAAQMEGKYQEALEIYDRLLIVQPRSIETLENAVTSAWQMSDRERVRTYAEKLSHVAPQSTHALWAQLVLAVEDQDYDKAAGVASSIAQANPASPADWYNLGVCLEHAGKYAEAAVAYEGALNLSQDDLDVRCDLAGALWESGQQQEAAAHYQKVLDVSPDFQRARRGLMAMALKDGDLERALECRIGLDDPDGEIAHALAVLRHRRGELEEASDLYRESLTRKPDRAEGQWNLGHALFALNRAAEAQKHWRLALEADPNLALASLR